MFTERHYKAIADLLVKTGFNHPQLIEAFCELFDGDNERFKPELFKKRAKFSEEAPTKLSRINVTPRPLSNETMREFGVSVKRDPWGFPIIPKKKS